jgi:dolichol-phosphate mannosyltransferase
MLVHSFTAATRRLARPLRFGVVGASGVVVNSGVLWLLAHGTLLPVWLASLAATSLAICTNFLLNDHWTFARAAHRTHARQRLLRFGGVSLCGAAITSATLVLLHGQLELPLLLANLAAIGCGAGWNYAASSRWTWPER